MYNITSIFRIQFLYLFTISTQGKMANLFLYLLVILSPMPSMTVSIGNDFV